MGASRLAMASCAALGLGAVASIGLSDLPATGAWPAAIACMGWGLWLAWRERRRTPVALVVGAPRRGGGRVPVHLDAIAGDWIAATWRGPLCVMTLAIDGRTQRLVLWPDVTGAAVRRELRLRAPRQAGAGDAASMAP